MFQLQWKNTSNADSIQVHVYFKAALPHTSTKTAPMLCNVIGQYSKLRCSPSRKKYDPRQFLSVTYT